MAIAQRQHSTIQQPGVSEIIVPAFQDNAMDLVMPMLAHLSQSAGERWMTWIGENAFPKSTFNAFQFETSKVRRMKSDSDQETLWMMWDALNNGTSTFVVGSFHETNSVQSAEVAHLERACFVGNARALILKQHR